MGMWSTVHWEPVSLKVAIAEIHSTKGILKYVGVAVPTEQELEKKCRTRTQY